MAAKVEISFKGTIKPSSPTPDHLRHFKISFLDQLAPPLYIPIVLFYSASEMSDFGTNFKTISHKLKTSLSDILTLYYPFCGRLKGNSSVECNDEGVVYIESKVPTELSNILQNPYINIIELLPFDPYYPQVENKKPEVNMAVQLNEFSCGGIALGVCFSHKIADGTTVGSFLNSWAARARGHDIDNIVAPQMEEEAALLFPPRNLEMEIRGSIVDRKNIVTRRFIFNKTNLSRLKEKLGCFNPTRVEVVTALIWKSAVEAAAKASSKEEQKHQPCMVSHAVNIRNRMASPMSKNMFGNLWQSAFSPLVEVDGEVGLHVLAEVVRKTTRKIDADYVHKLQGEGFVEVLGSLKEARKMVLENGTPCYSFSSWIHFGFYEADFGWGKPNSVHIIGVPMKNVVILMATRNGDGIEAWVTLTKQDMVEFERNPELLQYTSFDS